MNDLIQIINPFSEKPEEQFIFDSPSKINTKLQKANQAFELWRKTTYDQRSQALLAIANQLEKEKDSCVQNMMREMGKPLVQGIAEIEKCILTCKFFAEQGAELLATEQMNIGKRKAAIHFAPFGVVLAIMPWNYPYWQVFRYLAPAIMAGNVTLLKHAPNVTGCAIHIEKLVRASGVSDLILQTVLASVESTARMIESNLVSGVTFTGSVEAGKRVAALSGKNLKKSVLELGGSDPYLILEDADLQYAASMCATSRLINSGQSCIAAKRFIVPKKSEEPFLALLLQEFQKFKAGDPAQSSTQLGPLARIDVRQNLERQITDSVKKGALFHASGEIPEKGYFHQAGILNQVNSTQPAYREELFGPVATLLVAKDEADAVRIANDTHFGLGAGIFTRDIEKALYLAKNELHAGNVFINEFVKSDPRLPFGGIKDSGIGRELGQYGIKEFVNIKTITYD